MPGTFRSRRRNSSAWGAVGPRRRRAVLASWPKRVGRIAVAGWNGERVPGAASVVGVFGRPRNVKSTRTRHRLSVVSTPRCHRFCVDITDGECRPGWTITLVGPLRRIGRALLAFALVLLAGTVGYVILGFGVLDAVYQTVTTVTTVGFREVHPLTAAGQLFTILLILMGVGTALYTFGVLLEALIEGHLRQHMERWRMDRQISRMTGHIIVCGWGRVGRASVKYLSSLGQPAADSWPADGGLRAAAPRQRVPRRGHARRDPRLPNRGSRDHRHVAIGRPVPGGRGAP
jgi:hypothetical protein